MKFALPFGCLLAGIAIGWFAKPAPSASGAGPAVTASTSGASPSSMLGIPEKFKPVEDQENATSTRPSRPPIDSSKRQVDVKMEEAGKEMQKQMAKRMTDIQRKKFEARFAKLSAELNLTPDQQAKIRATMEERFSKMGELFTFDGGEGEGEKMKEISALMKSDGLEDATAAVLTDDQKSGFDSIKAKERQSRIDSKALKDLGTLGTVLDLSQDQKDAVYGVLSEQAAKQEDSNKSTHMMNMFTEGMGIQIDDELGIQDLMQDQMENHGHTPPDGDFKKVMAETIKKRTDERVEALRPVLTEQQLQQYRTHLETKASGMMNMFGGVEVQQEIVVPAQ
ncbi:MAG: hypothetical protein CFE26_16340 [Verrucomicrobiales bacterium VVV1]|nr:MAG: hypothetical protein CFE26_16340 [Verrucomicrobiales bacterium VVV1]